MKYSKLFLNISVGVGALVLATSKGPASDSQQEPAGRAQTAGPLTSVSAEADPLVRMPGTQPGDSEFMLSAHGQQGGADGLGPSAPSLFTTSLPGDKVGSCQDDGRRESRGQYVNGRRDGLWQRWDWQGKVVQKGMYRGGELINGKVFGGGRRPVRLAKTN